MSTIACYLVPNHEEDQYDYDDVDDENVVAVDDDGGADGDGRRVVMRGDGDHPPPLSMMGDMTVLIRLMQDINQIVEHEFDFLKLPRIVVIGDQSSGKSSTLEVIFGYLLHHTQMHVTHTVHYCFQALIQYDFLPRGQGCVTRCPLVLTLVRTKDQGGADGHDFIVTFLKDENSPEKRLVNPDRNVVSKEITQRTTAKAGEGHNIVKDPIRMRIEAPNVPNLELVDLPGFTKINTSI